MWILLDNDKQIIQVWGRPKAFEHNGNQYPSNWIQLASASDRSAIGLYSANSSTQPYDPDTQAITGETFVYDSDRDEVDQVFTIVNYTAGQLAQKAKNKLFNEAGSALTTSDQTMPRGTEDLIDTLITKGTIVLADLPQEAQDTYNLKKAMRTQRDANKPAE